MTRHTIVPIVLICGAILIVAWVYAPPQRVDRKNISQQIPLGGEEAMIPDMAELSSRESSYQNPSVVKQVESSRSDDCAQTSSSLSNSSAGLLSATETQDPLTAWRLLRSKVLRVAQKELVAKYNIKVSTGQIRDYIKEEVRPFVSAENFKEIKRGAEAQVTAAEAMFTEHLRPEQAAEQYLKPWGGAAAAQLLKGISSLEKVDEMRSMIPHSVEDMIEKSIPGHRGIVERDALANIILSTDEKRGGTSAWLPIYEERLLDYARKNLLGSHPELLHVRTEDLEFTPPELKTISSPLPPRNSQRSPGDTSPPGGRLVPFGEE